MSLDMPSSSASASSNSVTSRLHATQQHLQQALASAGRASDSAQLLAVSKTRPAEEIREAYNAGQRAFGENYMQDALGKQPSLEDLDIEWHFIGALQSNKTREAATHFDWVHTVDRIKIARRLDAQRPEGHAPLQICLQVNISRDPNKSGVLPEDAASVVEEILALPHLKLRGLMTIPAKTEDPSLRRAPFKALRELRDQLCQQFPEAPWDTLSMGMTADMDDAVAEGATIVRIGTAIFGERDYGTTH